VPTPHDSYDPTNAAHRTYLWSQCFVDELVRLGVETFFVAPGSRSTPLTVVVARHPKTTAHVHVDERGTAFAALGYGRATRRPAGWITTSGTAVANGLPAVVEASIDGVPMLCLTADRPFELRGSGANQTIDQAHIFGRYPRHFVDLPAPTAEVPLASVLARVDEAIYHAHRSPAGPVHINVAFRKPLEPVNDPTSPGDGSWSFSRSVQRWAETKKPFTQRPPVTTAAPDSALDRAAHLLQTESRGLIVAGRLDTDEEASAVRDLASRCGWPLVPDITSQLRLGVPQEEGRPLSPADLHCIAHADSILAHPQAASRLAPRAVLHLGGRTVSKRLRHLLRDAVPASYVVVRPDPARLDPDSLVTEHIEVDVEGFCRDLRSRLPAVADRDGVDHPGLDTSASEHASTWANADAVVRDTLERELRASGVPATQPAEEESRGTSSPRESYSNEGHGTQRRSKSGGEEAEPVLSEPFVARRISQLLPAEHALILASSMPVRDANRYADPHGSNGFVCANRGASGIDGTIATAAGVTIGRGTPSTLLIGDLASLHDLNSLSLLRQIPVLMVVVNNEGGGIFHFLPIRESEDVFETYFATPHPADFASAAGTFGISYDRVETPDAFDDAYRTAIGRGTSALIEVRTDRRTNRAIHEHLDARCAEAVGTVFLG